MAGIPGRRFFGGVVAFSSALALGAALAPPGHAAQGGGTGARAGEINVIAAHSGRCVEVENSSLVSGAPVVQADCTGQAGSVWRLQESPSGGGGVNLVNANSERCMEVQGTAVGSPVRQTDCSGQQSMSFRMVDRGTHVWLQPLSASPAKCLEVASGSHVPGVALRLAECSGQDGTGFRQRLPQSGNDPAEGGPSGVERVNVTPGGGQVPGGLGQQSRATSISANGRHLAFTSSAATLVAGDTNNTDDVFVRDRVTGVTERVSVSSTGAQGNALSTTPSISADGRYIAFYSDASTLVNGDTNKTADVFVHDRQTDITELISRSATGQIGASGSLAPSISEDGRHVSFTSLADNLVPGDTNPKPDVFVRDRVAGTIERVSVTSAGGQSTGWSLYSTISADGRYVSFQSDAENMAPGGPTGVKNDIFVRDRQAGATELISRTPGGGRGDGLSSLASMSPDGRFVVFTSAATNLVAGDTNAVSDVFVRDRRTGVTERVSVAHDGAQSLMASGVQYGMSLSADGRFVAFTSLGDRLVTGDTNTSADVFVRDRQTRTTVRASVNGSGVQGNSTSDYGLISSDGQAVLFESEASNLITGDTNAARDLFVRPRPRN